MEPTKTFVTIQNIKKVALVFFLITGLAHLSSSALIANNLFLKEAFIASKTLDIPFILTGLIYGFASLRLTLADPETDHKTLDIILIVTIILVLAGLIAVNLIFPDLKK
jgi:hypothetical protein